MVQTEGVFQLIQLAASPTNLLKPMLEVGCPHQYSLTSLHRIHLIADGGGAQIFR